VADAVMHILMARADAQAAAQRSGYSDAQRADLRARIAAGQALSPEDVRVRELGDGAHYREEAASSRSARAREMQEEFERVFWAVEPPTGGASGRRRR
jgi:glycerol-3-phosphate dehydrogenase